MTRWRLDIAYDGANFSGWATQPDRRTVQGELETWIPRVLRLDQPTPLTVAGRTDAGVHARGQVAHVDLPDNVDTSAMLRRLSRVLTPDIVVTSVRPVPSTFDARFSALWRRYVYRLWDESSRPDPVTRFHVAPVRGHLDLDCLNTAGTSLLGLRDFAAFCKHREGATTIRTLLDCHAERLDDPCGTVEVTVRADAFCHSMVRSLVGALTAVAGSPSKRSATRPTRISLDALPKPVPVEATTTSATPVGRTDEPIQPRRPFPHPLLHHPRGTHPHPHYHRQRLG